MKHRPRPGEQDDLLRPRLTDTRRARRNDLARPLMMVPGIGPLIATAIAVLAPPPETFRKARDFALWLPHRHH
jgi:transposase